MDLKQFRMLRAIAESGTFHGAALRLHLTQPAISHQIKHLEEELGESLVIRTRPRVSLTPAGLTVLAACERIEAEIESLRLHFSPPQAAEVSGVLRVAASTLGIIYLYGDLLEAFIAQHPRIELVVTATESGIGGARQVLAGTSDVAFTPFPIDLPHLTSTTLAQTHHVIIVSLDHALARRKRVSVQDLRRHPFIRYQTDAGSRTMSDQVFIPQSGYPDISLESNDTEFIKRVVALGMGAAMVPAFTLRNQDLDKRLRVLRLAGALLRQDFGLVSRTGMRSRTLLLFQEFCLDHRPSIGMAAAPTSAPTRGRARRKSPSA